MSSDLKSNNYQFNFKMDKSPSQKIYKFEDFRLDAAHRLLYKDGREISLTPKVVETLLALVEHCGEILSKDELIEIIWADSFVEEGNLTQNLYLLRKVLQKKMDGTPLIETLKRRGYRFNGEVSCIETKFNGNFLPDKNQFEPQENHSQSANRQLEEQIEFQTHFVAAEEKNIASSDNEKIAGRRFIYTGIGVCFLIVAAFFGSSNFPKDFPKSLPDNFAAKVQPATKLYWQMTEDRQLGFIRERARHIQTLIGDEPTEFDEESLRTIKVEIDHFVEDKDSLSQKPLEEGLRTVYGRGSQYAPLIIQAFEARQVPPALGLYQAMIESEYHDCLKSPTKSIGLFQFIPKTAADYDLTPKDYCNVKKQSDAAAHYMSDAISDFDNNKTLALLAFNTGNDNLREYLRQLREQGVMEQSAWAIFRHQQNLQPLTDDSKIYVQRFFAAAIIGETPEAFELSTPPLTTLNDRGK